MNYVSASEGKTVEHATEVYGTGHLNSFTPNWDFALYGGDAKARQVC
ncbi:hypothetical protein K2B15_002515 [Salmonella enterica subsp. enterica serovar Muenster]|nr:hypothetical protein [Salmonella enterica subsp. enterica]EGP2908843.1 hypothetical protein [Salmonella enterica subsp. enterica serovar Muenster]EHX6838311.1 hypothetical protein [Salmonella enterica subsp. enterica serovar Muenster]EMC1194187.1 hypothetical protein [Salmonella enterica]